MTQIYTHADLSLIRDDIDPKKAIDIMIWTLEGYANSTISVRPGENLGSAPRDNYDKYMEEFEEIIRILRKCFYKQSR